MVKITTLKQRTAATATLIDFASTANFNHGDVPQAAPTVNDFHVTLLCRKTTDTVSLAFSRKSASPKWDFVGWSGICLATPPPIPEPAPDEATGREQANHSDMPTHKAFAHF
jgi:hypothetical protein